MKLRNKKTMEIGEPRIDYQKIYVVTENHIIHCYRTLRGMFKEWEVYEEPEKSWYEIRVKNGKVIINVSKRELIRLFDGGVDKFCKEIDKMAEETKNILFRGGRK